MKKRALIPTGQILEFPAGTHDGIVDRAVREFLQIPVSQPPQDIVGTPLPIPQNIAPPVPAQPVTFPAIEFPDNTGLAAMITTAIEALKPVDPVSAESQAEAALVISEQITDAITALTTEVGDKNVSFPAEFISAVDGIKTAISQIKPLPVDMQPITRLSQKIEALKYSIDAASSRLIQEIQSSVQEVVSAIKTTKHVVRDKSGKIERVVIDESKA